MTENCEVVAVNRGTKGVAIINFAANANEFSLATELPDGEYNDKVYNQTFIVENGVLSGNAQAHTTYIISL